MNDEWWDSIGYFLKCTKPIISMLKNVNLDSSKLHLIYDMWDTMSEKVKVIVFKYEGKNLTISQSIFLYNSRNSCG
ncbi:hypothetical protein RND71_005868 [Anisodus tanguticus]|uniref:Uncharacterized protein n=1 Tax=Anisodus tanguticus TaxID=243964 RepID=A0AAE1VSR5_9SOLA|nr:hypothetical protein RND71_005868 [Anisodus tanguticus]